MEYAFGEQGVWNNREVIKAYKLKKQSILDIESYLYGASSILEGGKGLYDYHRALFWKGNGDNYPLNELCVSILKWETPVKVEGTDGPVF